LMDSFILTLICKYVFITYIWCLLFWSSITVNWNFLITCVCWLQLKICTNTLQVHFVKSTIFFAHTCRMIQMNAWTISVASVVQRQFWWWLVSLGLCIGTVCQCWHWRQKISYIAGLKVVFTRFFSMVHAAISEAEIVILHDSGTWMMPSYSLVKKHLV
jgi:hypothetical protein